MRAMPIRIRTGTGGWVQLKASFAKNWRHYLQEAFGLAVFMVSACFFGALLESKHSIIHDALPNGFFRSCIMGVLMGATALFIFYSPWTSPSGSQINPAVTLSFWRLGKMCHWDAACYILCQFIGGTVAVYLMQWLMGPLLTEFPVNSAATVPGPKGVAAAAIVEWGIAFITMVTILFTSSHKTFQRFTRLVAAILVCCWVIFAGPVSGFGMNPARTFASALPANTWTAGWIYFLLPVAGMLTATEIFVLLRSRKMKKFTHKHNQSFV
jgi:aquaporin Z